MSVLVSGGDVFIELQKAHHVPFDHGNDQLQYLILGHLDFIQRVDSDERHLCGFKHELQRDLHRRVRHLLLFI